MQARHRVLRSQIKVLTELATIHASFCLKIQGLQHGIEDLKINPSAREEHIASQPKKK